MYVAKIRIVCCITSVLLSAWLCAEPVPSVYHPMVVQGDIIVDDQSLGTSVIKLDGTWEFFWKELITTNPSKSPSAYLTVPGFWNPYVKLKTGKDNGTGSGSYRTVIRGLRPGSAYGIMLKESPGTACVLFANGIQVATSGKVSENPLLTEAHVQPLLAEMYSDNHGQIELVFQVSNEVYRKAGIWASVFFGRRSMIRRFYNNQVGASCLIIGMLIFLITVNFILFCISINKKQYLYFCIFVITLVLRISIAGFSVFTIAFPNISYRMQITYEYLAIWLAPITFLLMITHAYPTVTQMKKLKKIIIAVPAIIGILATLLPVSLSNYFVPELEVSAVLVLIYTFAFLIQALRQHQQSVWLHFSSMVIVGSGFIIDVIFSSVKTIVPVSLMPFLLLLFAIIQFLLLSQKQSKLYQKQIVLLDDMKKLNEAYIRFVPKEFLSLLNKNSMTDVLLGDHIEKEMTILFSRIHFSKSDNSELTSEEQYFMFCNCLLEVSAIITRNGGFISKFISGGFMSLFPNSPKDALLASIEISSSLAVLNKQQQVHHDAQLQLGIGVHFGKMILGTIGEENRLDDTVISDTVNTAARIESVSESCNCMVVISQSVYDALGGNYPNNVTFGSLGVISVKGKKKPILLFACRSTEHGAVYE